MPTPQDLSLTLYFTHGMLQQVTKKPLFGSPYVEVGALLGVQAQLFEMGAVLGRAKKDSLAEVLKLIGDPTRSADFYRVLEEACKERLQSYGREPDSFWNYIMETEVPKFSRQSPDTFLLSKEAQQRVTSGVDYTALFMAEGIVFGALYPDLTFRLVSDSISSMNKTRPDAFKAGLAIPSEPDIRTYEDYEKGVLAVVDEYASEYHY